MVAVLCFGVCMILASVATSAPWLIVTFPPRVEWVYGTPVTYTVVGRLFLDRRETCYLSFCETVPATAYVGAGMTFMPVLMLTARAIVAVHATVSAGAALVAAFLVCRMRGSSPVWARGCLLRDSKGGCCILSVPAMMALAWTAFALGLLSLVLWLSSGQMEFYPFSRPSIIENVQQGSGFVCMAVSSAMALALAIYATVLHGYAAGWPGIGAAVGQCCCCRCRVTAGAPGRRQSPATPTAGVVVLVPPAATVVVNPVATPATPTSPTAKALLLPMAAQAQFAPTPTLASGQAAPAAAAPISEDPVVAVAAGSDHGSGTGVGKSIAL